MNRCIGIGLFIIITKFTHFLDFIDDVKHFKTSGVWQKGFLGLENNLDIYYPTAANNPSFRELVLEVVRNLGAVGVLGVVEVSRDVTELQGFLGVKWGCRSFQATPLLPTRKIRW